MNKKTESVTARFTKANYAIIKEKANIASLSIAEFVAHCAESRAIPKQHTVNQSLCYSYIGNARSLIFDIKHICTRHQTEGKVNIDEILPILLQIEDYICQAGKIAYSLNKLDSEAEKTPSLPQGVEVQLGDTENRLQTLPLI